MATKAKTICERADEILRRWVETDEVPTYDDMAFLRGELNWDDRKIRQQRRRINTVVKNQMTARDQAYRDELAEAADQAEHELKERGDELRKQIDNLTAELNQMERTVELRRKRCCECQDALDSLRNSQSLPDDVRDKHSAKIKALSETTKRELLDVESEIRHIELLDKLDTRSPHDLGIIRTHGTAYVENHKGTLVVTPAWSAFVAEQRAKLPTLREGQAELQAEYNATKAEIDQLLNHYVT